MTVENSTVLRDFVYLDWERVRSMTANSSREFL